MAIVSPSTSESSPASMVAGPLSGVAFGLAALVAAPTTAHPGPVWAGGATVTAMAAAGGAVAMRRAWRRRRIASLHQALALLTGPGSMTRIRASRWRGGFRGVPIKVTINYDPAARTRDTKWLPAVLETCQARLGVPYQSSAHDEPGCQLTLRYARPRSGPQPSPAQARAERTLLRLLGAGSNVGRIETDGAGLVCRVHATFEDPTRFATIGHQRRLERTFTEVTPGRWRGRWDLENDRVTFEVRPVLPSNVWLPPAHPCDTEDLLRNYRQVQIPYAVDEDGEEIVWRPAELAHLLVTGGTGTGKTSVAHSLLNKICQHDWPVWVLDGKRVEFLHLRDWPNVQIVATTVEQQVALIYQVKELVDYRYALIEEGRARVEDFEPLVVFLDEWSEFINTLLDWYADVKRQGEPTKPPTVRQEASLARKARVARVHLVKFMQRADVALMGPGAGGEVRSNFGMRLTMGPIDPDGAQMMWGNPATGVTLPRGVPGRATALTRAGLPVEAQCYRFPDPTSAPDTPEGQLLAQLRPRKSRWPRLLVVPAREVAASKPRSAGRANPDDSLTFWDYATAPWVLASARPDIDPLMIAANADPAQGRRLSSTMAMLGLDTATDADDGDQASGAAGHSTRAEDPPPPVADAPVEDPPGPSGEGPDVDGMYAQPVQIGVEDVQAGDLILIDAEQDRWVVVQLPVEPDHLDDDQLIVCWADFDQGEGVASFAFDDAVLARRPNLHNSE